MNTLLKSMVILATFLYANGLFAAKVDTVITFSTSMKKNIKAVVITPDSYGSQKKFPVVYLLHGYSGNQGDWIKKAPVVAGYADQFNCIIVCPDGNFSSWYMDSPMDSAFRYETYVSGELVTWIDNHYSTINKREGRAITGLSMGGHGGLYLSFKHQEVYGAGGSMSGGVDITPFPNNWEIAKLLGTYAQNPGNWRNNTVYNLTHLLTPNSLAIIIDCGIDDFFYKVNVNLHEKLLYSNIPHDFISRPGAHNWDYWSNAVGFQMMFFNNYFVKMSQKKS